MSHAGDQDVDGTALFTDAIEIATRCHSIKLIVNYAQYIVVSTFRIFRSERLQNFNEVC